ncbi:MAG: SCP2 sterol-binding domain-containing protein [Firmicutes bacterium]|nr:SCP2 sterol-binding domain-containing protein [Bacillota bacterium]
MPTQALINAFAERLVNTALAEDRNAPKRLAAVKGKTFRLRLDMLPWPLTMTFCADRVFFMGEDYDAVDGEVTTSVAVLSTLRDASQVTAALQRGELQLSGDPIFAQQASQVLLGLEIDWEESFAKRIGDVPGYWAGQGLAWLRQQRPNLDAWQQWFGETLSEEKKLTVGQVEYALFSDELKQLAQRVRQLEGGES